MKRTVITYVRTLILVFIVLKFDFSFGQCGLSVSATASSTAVCAGNGVSFNATSNNPSATYTWEPLGAMTQNYGTTNSAFPTSNTTYTVTAAIPSGIEKVVNGNFEAGVTGFTSSYYNVNYTGPTALYSEATYAVGQYASQYHGGFPAIGNRTPGGSLYMIVNGAVSYGTKVWAQTMTVTPGKTYIFSCWAATIVAHSYADLSTLNFDINGVNMGPFFQPSIYAGNWTYYSAAWVCPANTYSITLKIENSNTVAAGNDFGLDDISFKETCSASYAIPVSVITPTATNNGPMCSSNLLTLSGNPAAPGVSYRWTGPNGYSTAYSSSSTAQVSNPTSGTYTLTANTGSSTCSASTAATIYTSPTATITTPSSSVCTGTATSVTVSGTAGAIVTYRLSDVGTTGPLSAATIGAGGTVTIPIGTLVSSKTFALVSASRSTAPACAQNLSQTITLTVLPLPTATIAGGKTICANTGTNITFTGPANGIVTYRVGSGANQTVNLDASGNGSVLTGNLVATTSYNLVSVAYAGATACSQAISGSTTVTVISTLTASVTGTTSICAGNASTLTFNATPNATVSYTINGGAAQTIPITASGSASLSTGTLTASATYALTSISLAGSCTQAVSGNAVVTVIPLPTASISGTVAICSGTSTSLTVTGTANSSVAYKINNGPTQTVAINSTGTVTLPTGNLTASAQYELQNVALTGANTCTQTLTSAATVTVIPLPTASISGTTTICSGGSATLTVTATANSTVSYKINNGAIQTISIPISGTASILATNVTATTHYDLVSITLSGANPCTQSVTSSATVTVIPLPTATIAGVDSICSGTKANLTITATPNSTVSYTIGNGTAQTISVSATGQATFLTPVLTSTTEFELTSVALNGANTCTQTISNSVIVNVVPLPTAVVTGSTTICWGNSTSLRLTGTPNTIVTYNVNNGTTQTIAIGPSGSTVIQTGVLTTTSQYDLQTVTLTGSNACTQTISSSATVTVLPLPTASIAGSVSICSGSSANLTVTATPNSVVAYKVNGGSTQTLAIDGTGTASLPTGNLTATSTFALVDVTTTGDDPCSQPISGSATVTVINLPTASITGTISICSGASAAVTIHATANSIVHYKINNGATQSSNVGANRSSCDSNRYFNNNGSL